MTDSSTISHRGKALVDHGQEQLAERTQDAVDRVVDGVVDAAHDVLTKQRRARRRARRRVRKLADQRQAQVVAAKKSATRKAAKAAQAVANSRDLLPVVGATGGRKKGRRTSLFVSTGLVVVLAVVAAKRALVDMRPSAEPGPVPSPMAPFADPATPQTD